MVTVGFAICGSFCTFGAVFTQIEQLVRDGYDIIPIMSYNACTLDTRFGAAAEHVARIEHITGKKVMSTLQQVEPIGPKNLLDALIIAPCTGNTLAKLSTGIADTCVTFAAKAHLRNERPVLIGVSTNDALSAAAKNIGALQNTKHIYFIPYRQDDSSSKPNSLVADFSKTKAALEAALKRRQMQPVVLCPK